MVTPTFGRVLFGLLEFAVGFAMLFWPQRMLGPWASARAGGPGPGKGVLIVQRGMGLALLVMGAVIVYSGLVPDSDAPLTEKGGPEAVAALVFEGLWVVVGMAMILWPTRVRSLTNPDWQRYEKLPFASSSLVSYRATGLVFVFIGSTAILLFFNRIQ